MAEQVLTKSHYDMLRAAQRRLHDLLPFVDKAESCGFDCQPYRQAHADFGQQIEKLLTEFFTPPPR